MYVNNKEAFIRYIGTVNFGAGLFYGVEVPINTGYTNGTENDSNYFTCPENSGMFLKY